jgi:hypothetical protein
MTNLIWKGDSDNRKVQNEHVPILNSKTDIMEDIITIQPVDSTYFPK